MKKHSIDGKFLNDNEFSSFNASLSNVPIFITLENTKKTPWFSGVSRGIK